MAEILSEIMPDDLQIKIVESLDEYVHAHQTSTRRLGLHASFLKPINDGLEWFKDRYPPTVPSTYNEVRADIYVMDDFLATGNRDFHLDSHKVVSCAVSNDRDCQAGTIVLPPDAFKLVDDVSSAVVMEVMPNRRPQFKLSGNIALLAYNDKIVQAQDGQCIAFNASTEPHAAPPLALGLVRALFRNRTTIPKKRS